MKKQINSHYKTTPKFYLINLTKKNTKLQHNLKFSTKKKIESYNIHNNKKHISKITHKLYTIL